jgi:hypothetical protein
MMLPLHGLNSLAKGGVQILSQLSTTGRLLCLDIVSKSVVMIEVKVADNS